MELQIAATNRLSAEVEGIIFPVFSDVPNGVKKDSDPNHIDRDTEPAPSSPSDPPSPVYYFGFRFWHPKWLQILADAKFYTFILVLFVLVEGAITSGKNNI